MGGLAIGSWTIGQYADKWNDKKIAISYFFVEIIIGLYALVLPFFIKNLESFYILIYSYLSIESFTAVIIKFFLGFFVLIIPTFLMGTTLPLITRFLSRNWENYSKNISLLYGLNTLGAIIGTLFAGFYLLENYGISGASLFSASINFFVAICFLVFWKFIKLPERKIIKEKTDTIKNIQSNDFILILLTSYTLSGMASMFYQISWTRALSLILGTSTYAFTVILATFLLGISIGSFLYRYLPNRRNKTYIYIIIQAIIILSVLISSIYFDELPLYYLYVREIFFNSWIDLNYIRFLLAAIIIIIPTLGMGLLFPLVCDLISSENKKMSHIVGKTYALNSIGAMMGSTCAGLFVIPTIGIQYAIYTGVFLNILAALIVILQSKKFKNIMKIILSLIFLITYIIFILNTEKWSPKVMSSGVSIYADNYFKVSNKYKELSEAYSYSEENLSDIEIWKSAMLNYDLLYYKDGLVDSVAVMKNNKGVISLLVNGKVDASARGEKDIITQIMIGQLPLLLHENPKNVFLVGYASGITAGSILTHPIIKLDTAEISPSIVEASKFFDKYNNNPLKDKRIDLRISDAKHSLMVSEKKYDVIVSQPSNPWIKGQSSLFSFEWYKIVKEHLNDNGLFMQWLPTYHISEDNLKIIINTLNKVFPNLTLWTSTSPGDLILLASKNKDFKVSHKEVIKRINYPEVKQQLQKIGLYSDSILRNLFLKDDTQVNEYLNINAFNSLLINRDDLLITQYSAPKDMVNNSIVELFLKPKINNIDEDKLKKLVPDIPE
jgi:spermidine synthase